MQKEKLLNNYEHQRFIKRINRLSGVFDIKLLKGEFGDFKRLRVGDYRIIFDEENKVINVYNIKHRKEAYL